MGANQRFRVTVWPNEPIPERPLLRPTIKVGSSGKVAHDGARPDLEPSTIPTELYLRELRDLDLADESAVIGFIEEHGADEFIGHPLDHAVSELRIVRRLVEFWHAHQVGDVGPNDKLDYFRFVELIGNRLTAFAPGVEVFFPDGDFISEAPNLTAALCLQLWNDMCEGATFRRCANEPCRRMFYRQLGRAKAGQYRTVGVKYCTDACASAASSRAARQRKKDEAR